MERTANYAKVPHGHGHARGHPARHADCSRRVQSSVLVGTSTGGAQRAAVVTGVCWESARPLLSPCLRNWDTLLCYFQSLEDCSFPKR